MVEPGSVHNFDGLRPAREGVAPPRRTPGTPASERLLPLGLAPSPLFYPVIPAEAGSKAPKEACPEEDAPTSQCFGQFQDCLTLNGLFTCRDYKLFAG
jgi:hypothetical protein